MDYLPRFLLSTRPPGDDVYEVLVAGEDALGVLNKLTGVLSQNEINFSSSHGQVDEAGKTFVNVFFCNMAKAKLTPDELQMKLENLPFVKQVRIAPMKGLMYEEHMFPVSTMFAGRALVVGAAAFSQIEGRLVEIFGSAGEVMAYEQGRAYALATLADMEQYRMKVGAVWDLENIAAWVRAQGWASVRIREVPAGYMVNVYSVPAPMGQREMGGLSWFLTGMIVGMLEYLAGQRLAAEPTLYDPESDTHSFGVRKQAKAAKPV